MEDFISEMKRARVRIREEPNCLVWLKKEASGKYKVKVGYQVLLNAAQDPLL